MNFEKMYALMDGDSVVYVVASYHGHICRMYPDGKIKSADEYDMEAARQFNCIK